MSEQRTSAPVQRDPIRARLGREGPVRDVRCPNCGATYATSRRIQMLCPECDHIWIDRSSRTFVDEVRDSVPNAFVAIVIGGSVILALGSMAIAVFKLFCVAVDRRGWDDTVGIAVFFCLCAVSILVISLVRVRPSTERAQRPLPLRPENELDPEASRSPADDDAG
jgi:hypothetical protein